MAGHVLGMTEGFTGLRRMATGMVAADAAGRGRARHRRPHRAPGREEQRARRPGARAPDGGRRACAGAVARAGPLSCARCRRRSEINGAAETWRMAYILDVILTRDTWMHRVDVAYATGRDLALTPEHDGRIVADVVAEWGRRHGRAVRPAPHRPGGRDLRPGRLVRPGRADHPRRRRVLPDPLGEGRGAGPARDRGPVLSDRSHLASPVRLPVDVPDRPEEPRWTPAPSPTGSPPPSPCSCCSRAASPTCSAPSGPSRA